jgi:PAS domain S-box-containing protein
MYTDILEVPDATKDSRFEENELVTGSPNIRFYAGYPLIDQQGYALGTLCVIDRAPKTLTDQQKKALRLLSEEVISLITERRQKQELKNFEKLFALSNDLIFVGGVDGFFKKINPAFEKVFGWSSERLLNNSYFEFIHPDDISASSDELYKLSQGFEIVNFVHRFKTFDNKYRNIQWTVSPEPFTNNIFGIGRDITD